MSTFGFIGCGNMGGSLASAVATVAPAGTVVLCDHTAAKAQALADRIGASCVATAAGIVAACDVVFLGVKPQAFPSLFEEIRPALTTRASSVTLVSMAAGITLDRIAELAGCTVPTLRIMPNLPVSVGEGVILYAANDALAPDALNGILAVMSAAGHLHAVREEKMDAAAALAGCAPAFVALFAEALADGAVACGIPRADATAYAAETILGSARLLAGGTSPAALKDAVCSPGGTTIAGVRALEEGGFRAAAMNAVIAAYEKTAKLK